MSSKSTDLSVQAPALSLEHLRQQVAGSSVYGAADTIVRGVFQDSRRVEKGSMFAVRSGAKSDGRAFIPAALEKGASSLLTEDSELARSVNIPSLIVPSVRDYLGKVAMASYGLTKDSLSIIGLTGTNGKTTTTYLTQAVLAEAGFKTATLGTIGLYYDNITYTGSFTTPEGDDLARLLAFLVAKGATHLVMEVSSHALELRRVEGLSFVATGFTNLTQDHLDLHGTMEAYGEAKARLFIGELAAPVCVIHVGDSFGERLANRAKGRVIRVAGRSFDGATISVPEVSWSIAGLNARLLVDGHPMSLVSPLVGAHNLENLVVSLGIAYGLGVDMSVALQALAKTPAVPGRLERCSTNDDDVLVVVDYAHTPDALVRALDALRPLTPGKLVCVFGCGGDRDPAKRPLMGAAVAQGADTVFVTNDNPRSEKPEAIVAAIEPGIKQHNKTYQVIYDRSQAIERAVCEAAPGDIVLIAGKGHEPYQIVGSEIRDFDDRREARRALTIRRASKKVS